MQTLHITVENIKCGGCANSVRKALKDFPEVRDVQVSHETGEIEILTDNPDNRPEYSAALARIGYPESGANNLLAQAKSYVSCAIGRFSD
ncbi:MAG: heavy-metal-associated domain-containing protein [Saprospiraceae bacterium]